MSIGARHPASSAQEQGFASGSQALRDPARQGSRLTDPRRHLRLVERVVLADVEVTYFRVLGLARGDGTQRTALRGGDFEGLLAVLDPDLVVRADMAVPRGAPSEIRGAAVWAKGAVAYGHLAQLTRAAMVDGAIGVVVAPRGRLVRALRFVVANGRITEIEVIGNPARLAELDVSMVD